MAHQEPPDYCWKSSFENGLFYLENWQTGHKYRAVVGLTEMTVQLLSTNRVSEPPPAFRRISGLLHFLAEFKLNFCFPNNSQAAAVSSVSVLDLTAGPSPVPSRSGTHQFNASAAPPESTSSSFNSVANAVGSLTKPTPSSYGNSSWPSSPTQYDLATSAVPSIQTRSQFARPSTTLGVAVTSCSSITVGSNFLTRSASQSGVRDVVPYLEDKRCHICQRAFNSRSMLRRHMVVHSTVPKYVCELCGKGFKYRWNYTNHINQKCPNLARSNTGIAGAIANHVLDAINTTAETSAGKWPSIRAGTATAEVQIIKNEIMDSEQQFS